MPQVGLIAESQVDTEHLDDFRDAARRELVAVRSSEPERLRFDVVFFDERSGHGAFVEVFLDEAAAEAHRGTSHFAAFFEEIAGMDVKWPARRGRVLTID